MSRLHIYRDITDETRNGYILMSIICLTISIAITCMISVTLLEHWPLTFILVQLIALTANILLFILCIAEAVFIRRKLVSYIQVSASDRDFLPDQMIVVGKIDGSDLYVRVRNDFLYATDDITLS